MPDALLTLEAARERVLFHEAAHLTVALVLGVPVESAECDLEKLSGCVTIGQHPDVAVVAIAGSVGEVIAFGGDSVSLSGSNDAGLLAAVPHGQQLALANIASAILQGPARQRWEGFAELLRHKPTLSVEDLR